MPRIFPVIAVPRNMVYITESFGVLGEVVQGGEHGRWKWLWPWQQVKDQVFTGLVTLQVLQGDRRLHFAGGSWMDFEEAVIVTRAVDPVKMTYDVRYQDLSGTILSGRDGAAALMRANVNDAIQSFMAGKDLRDAIYLSGPEVTDHLNLLVPNAQIRPEFAAITNETGIAVNHVRFSGVKLSEKYVEAMEGIRLNIERLNVVKQEREAILQFLRSLVETDPEQEPTTLTQAANLFKTLSLGEMLQNMSGQLLVAGTGQMALLWPALMQMFGVQPPGPQRRGRRRQQGRNQEQGGDQEE